MLHLLVVERVLQKRHLLRVHEVSVLLLLIKPIDLVYQLLDLPLVVFELLM